MTNTNEAKLIVLVDEDPSSLKKMKELAQLEYPNAVVMHFTSAARVLDIVKAKDLSLLVTELGFGDAYSGTNLIEDLRKSVEARDLPIMIMTDPANKSIDRDALDAMNVQVLNKPMNKEVFINAIKQNLKPDTATQPKGPVRTINLKVGDYLFREGDKGRNLYLLEKGSLIALKKAKVKKTKAKARTDTIEVGEIRPGQIFGEMAFLDGSPRSVSIRAIEVSKVFELKSEELQDYLSSQPAWMKILFESLLGRIRGLNNLVAELRRY